MYVVGRRARARGACACYVQLEDVGYDICVLYIDTDKLRKREELLSVLTYVPRVGKEFMPVGGVNLVDV